MKLPWITFVPDPLISIPSVPQRLMARPRTVLAPASNRSPVWFPALAPLISMTGLLLVVKPFWVVPSTTTGSVMGGNGLLRAMVCTFVPEISKTMVSTPGLLLASRIACRREPAPLSLLFVTVSVAP